MKVEEIKQLLQPISSQKLFRQNPLNDIELLNALSELKAQQGKKLHFLYLWGVYNKPIYDDYDVQALDYLKLVITNISHCLALECELTLLICDAHAMTNGISKAESAGYINGIKHLIEERGWQFKMLSHMNIPTAHDIDVESKIAAMSTAARSELTRAAEKYSRNSCKENGLREYVKIRLTEKSWLAKQFKGFFHLTAANPAIAALQPIMPTFWLWVTSRGKTTKPWFKKSKG